MKNKKASHVGMILSFVVFVTFLFFIFSILNPAVKQEREKQMVLDTIKENLIQNLSSNLSLTSLKIKGKYDLCFDINDFLTTSQNIKVKDELGNNIAGLRTIVSGSKTIRINPGGDSSKDFFKIYQSEEFLSDSPTSATCTNLDAKDYAIASSRVEKYLFKGKITILLEEYTKDYLKLKENLGISEDNDFAISVEMDGVENTPQGDFGNIEGNVYAEEIPIQYYDEDANIKYGVITLRVW